jgi:8-oxo-dGTP pyrophosphatase MutT (NUDIX family)
MISKISSFFSRKKWRRGVFIVAYRKKQVASGRWQVKFLIQKRKLHWKGYEFPKGGIEKSEGKIKTIKREILEETGLPIIKLKNHHKRGRYFYSKELKDRPGVVGQTWSLYSAEVGDGKVRIDQKEHSGHEWLGYREARKRLTYENQKECLGIVWKWVRKGID